MGKEVLVPVTRTLAHLGLALPPRLELVEGVDHGEDLHGADGVEHVGVVAWGGAKAAAVVLAREHKVYGAVSREGVRAAQQVQGDEAPVEAVEAEVLGQPVVILVLARVEGLDVFHVGGGGELQLVRERVQLCGHDGGVVRGELISGLTDCPGDWDVVARGVVARLCVPVVAHVVASRRDFR